MGNVRKIGGTRGSHSKRTVPGAIDPGNMETVILGSVMLSVTVIPGSVMLFVTVIPGPVMLSVTVIPGSVMLSVTVIPGSVILPVTLIVTIVLHFYPYTEFS
jgi:hypothetical protein